jgi:uncharacterized protein (TIGR00251 family)
VRISVTVKPNSRVEEVTSDGERLLVKVKEPPKEGKANRAVVKLLSAYFGVPQSSVIVISGLGSKSKVIEISGK